MGNKNRRATMKCWYPHTNRLKYCSSAKFDEQNNKFGKFLLLGSEVMIGTNISILPTLKIDLLYHSFIKYDIFEGIVNIPPIGTTIGIIT